MTLQMSQSASALHEQLSSHFFRSSHNLKFLNCFSSFLISSRSRLGDPNATCYPCCHMKTSCRWSWFGFPRTAAISSSKVTIFSRPARDGALRGTRTVRGSMFAEIGASPLAIDKSNSLILRGTKYSISGSAPVRRRIHDKFRINHSMLCFNRLVYNSTEFAQ